jgi:hypothetical protein
MRRSLTRLNTQLANPMCGFSDEELGELKGWIAHLMVEQEGYGVREDFAQHSACQMPEGTRPHLLHAVALGELRKNGVYPVAKPTEEGTLFRGRVSLLGGIRGQKLHTNVRQLLPGFWRMVVAISAMIRPEVPSASSGSTQSSWALAGATEKRVITPGQHTLTCTL